MNDHSQADCDQCGKRLLNIDMHQIGSAKLCNQCFNDNVFDRVQGAMEREDERQAEAEFYEDDDDE